MMLFERTMKDIEAACKKLGWERMGEGSDQGMVIGTSEYVKGIEGALVGAALHGIGGGELPIAERSRLEGPESPIDEIAPEVTPSESPTEAVQEDPILPPESEAPKSKTVGRILGAVNGKPVGMLSQENGTEEG